jgi:5-methylcytosine-specific restriction endonuclease McrA
VIEKPHKEPKKRKPLKNIGKWTLAWKRTRAEWLRLHPADYRGMWQCAYCGNWFEHITLDHKLGRGAHPEERYNLDNLVPLCAPCHVKKDSGFTYK